MFHGILWLNMDNATYATNKHKHGGMNYEFELELD